MESKEHSSGENSPNSVDMAAFYGNAASAVATGHVFKPEAKAPSQQNASGAEAMPAEEPEQTPPQGGEENLSSAAALPNAPDAPEDKTSPAAPGTAEDGKAPVPDAPAPKDDVPDFAAFHHQPALWPEDGTAKDPAPAAPDVDDSEDGDEGAEDDVPMSLMGHLNELRRRLFRIVIIVILGFVAFYGVSEQLYAWLSEPLRACLPEGSKLVYTSPQGAFFTYMKVALVASLFGTSPFSFYQLWAFIAPGLYREEKRAVLPLAFFSSLFFVAGASFCFLLVFPIAFQFFMGFATDAIVPMISVEEYLSFALKLLIAFGVVFEMPLFAYFLARFGLLAPDFMRRTRKYAILAIFIVAAILTPPDVFSQVFMALPMILLYEVSIYVAAAAYRKKESKDASEEKESS